MRIRSCVIPFLVVLTALLLVAPAASQTGGSKATPVKAPAKKAPAKKTPAGKATGKAARKGVDAAAGKRKAANALIAVVDLEKALIHTKAFKTGVANAKRQAVAYQKELDAMKTVIKELDLDIAILVDDPKRLKLQLQVETLIGGLNLAGKMFNLEMERQKNRNDDKIYVELSQAVADLASRRGILLVLRKHEHRTIKELLAAKMALTRREARNKLIRTNQQRAVIYHAPDLDLTEDLIKYLKAK